MIYRPSTKYSLKGLLQGNLLTKNASHLQVFSPRQVVPSICFYSQFIELEILALFMKVICLLANVMVWFFYQYSYPFNFVSGVFVCLFVCLFVFFSFLCIVELRKKFNISLWNWGNLILKLKYFDFKTKFSHVSV